MQMIIAVVLGVQASYYWRLVEFLPAKMDLGPETGLLWNECNKILVFTAQDLSLRVKCSDVTQPKQLLFFGIPRNWVSFLGKCFSFFPLDP